MKIVITGATGFVGRNIAESLVKDGHEVMATGRSSAVGETLRQQGIAFKQADLVDESQVIRAISAADCLIHCAAKTGDWGSYRDFFSTNVLGTRHVIQACQTHDIKKIIFVSTPSIYFDGTDRLDISEDEPLPKKQASVYGKTKLISENELTAKEGHDVIIFRPRAVYGPYDSTFVPRILGMAKKKQFPLINNGQALVDITYVDNFVDAVKKSLNAPSDAWNQAYNVSNNDPITIHDWFSEMLQALGRPFKPKNIPEPMAKAVAGMMEWVKILPFSSKKPTMTRFSVGYMAKSMTLSIEKAKQKLGYEPRIGNKESFELLAEWLQKKNKG